jgi:hypothetical protein
LSRAASAVRNGLWLAGPRSVVRARPADAQTAIGRWWRAAEARLRVARQLSPETEFAPAVALYREGITALVAAALVAVEGPAASPATTDMRAAWASLERLWPKLGSGVDIREFAAAGRALCEPEPLDASPLDPAEAAILVGAMARLSVILARAIEPRTRRRLALIATMRMALLAAVVAAAIAVPVRRALAPRNLALNKPVTLSSIYTTRRDVGGAYLVNGKLEYGYGGHTDNPGPDNPWMTIDLGAPTRIGKIAVYNRGDGFFDDCLPLTLSVGLDPSAATVLGVRDKPFARTQPWVLDHLAVTARYVRVSKVGAGYIALDEIEVYAP